FYLNRPSSEAIAAIELVDHRARGDRVRLDIRFAFTGELNAAARAILDPTRLTWIQSTEHELSSGRVTFRILPDHYADRMRCQGRYRVEAADGDTSTRTVATELHVRAPLVGVQVERVLLDGLRNELDAQARAIPDYVP
ncbi:MAG: DUF2505 family protein, partial [Actinobacteria bacterium]|nr:DUF2505 family protein [Actinomycetota bacterium]